MSSPLVDTDSFVWVFLVFGVVPSGWTLAGGALLLLTLIGHEIAGMGAAAGGGSPGGEAAGEEEEDPSYRYVKA